MAALEDLEGGAYLPLLDPSEMLNEPMNDKAMISPKEFFFQFYHQSHESLHALVYKVRHEGWAFFKEESFPNKVMIVLEIPFTLARTLTIPAVDSEMYFKPFFVASWIGLPFWVLFNGVGVGGLSDPGWLCMAAAASIFLGTVALTFAPSGQPPMIKLGTKFPFGLAAICLMSFVLAALWINFIATELVCVVAFVGSITGIDDSILGITVIAWGNSVGDFSSNLAMAKRGLGNVSMTASFAGPVFNILIGLGFGFLFYFAAHDVTEARVKLTSVTFLALACIVLNALVMLGSGVCNGGRIPRGAGYVAIATYACYVATAVVLTATEYQLPFLKN